MHRDIAKMQSLGVDENFLKASNLTPEIARDLVRGLLYPRERYPRQA